MDPGIIWDANLCSALSAERPTPFAMQWGYTMLDRKRIINARSETASEKPMFKDGMLQRRCLIPASHYFEWEKREAKKIKYAIRPEGAKLLYMAGIYAQRRASKYSRS